MNFVDLTKAGSLSSVAVQNDQCHVKNKESVEEEKHEVVLLGGVARSEKEAAQVMAHPDDGEIQKMFANKAGEGPGVGRAERPWRKRVHAAVRVLVKIWHRG